MVKDHSDSERGNRCRHMGYSFRLAALVILYASSNRHNNTYHGFCYTSRGALAGMRNSSSHHERTLLPWSYILLPMLRISKNNNLSVEWNLNDSSTSFLSNTSVLDSPNCGELSEYTDSSHAGWESHQIIMCSLQSLKQNYSLTKINLRPTMQNGVTYTIDISRSSQCSTTGVTKAVICVILSMGCM